MIRVRAGISYVLTEAMDEGNCGLPIDELGPLSVALLEVPETLVRTALDLELAEGNVVADRVTVPGVKQAPSSLAASGFNDASLRERLTNTPVC
jgi:hypothetical protein